METKSAWELEREAESIKNQARWDKGANVLELLGFSVLPIHEGSYESGPVGVTPSGAMVHIRTMKNYTNKGRFEVSHNMRNGWYKHRGYDEPRLEITLSSDKTVEQLAKDIKRRIVPDIEAEYARLKQRHENALAYENGKNQLLETLAKSVGHNLSQWERDNYKFRTSSINVAVHGPESVEIKMTLDGQAIAETARSLIYHARSAC